jgi:hypothetical protein
MVLLVSLHKDLHADQRGYGGLQPACHHEDGGQGGGSRLSMVSKVLLVQVFMKIGRRKMVISSKLLASINGGNACIQ